LLSGVHCFELHLHTVASRRKSQECVCTVSTPADHGGVVVEQNQSLCTCQRAFLSHPGFRMSLMDSVMTVCSVSVKITHTPPFPPAFPINPRFRPDTLAHRTTFLCFCLRICRMQTFLILSLSMISLFQL